MITRRKAIAGIVGAGAVSALAPRRAFAATKLRLKLASTWSPKLPVLQDGAEMFAKLVEVATRGEVKIKVYAGGELVPALGVFDAVSSGSIDMGIGYSGYWSGKAKATPFFGSVPFGMSAQHMNAWLTSGGGQELWNELYANFNLVPMSIGNSGTQMAGWYKKELKSAADLKGLKMRIPGIGGQVMAKAGVNVVLMPGGELFTALERGTIDATEWVNPYHDERLGLHRAAKFCYYPGWQEPSANLELMINKSTWDKLPQEHHAAIKAVAAQVSNWTLCESEARNGPALKRLVEEHGVKLLPLPEDVLETLRKHSDEVLNEMALADPFSKKVLQSYKGFQNAVTDWAKIGEYSVAKFLV